MENLIAAEIGEMVGTTTARAAGVGAALAGALHLKLIIVLAIVHPMLAGAAGVGALAAYLGIGQTVGSAVQDAVKDHEFNAVTLNMLHLALSESALAKRLADGRRAAEADLQRAIVESLTTDRDTPGLVTRATDAFDAMLRKVIADLGVLERPV
jgi:hypothetical protein